MNPVSTPCDIGKEKIARALVFLIRRRVLGHRHGSSATEYAVPLPGGLGENHQHHYHKECSDSGVETIIKDQRLRFCDLVRWDRAGGQFRRQVGSVGKKAYADVRVKDLLIPCSHSDSEKPE